jgi:4-azaleucine resistance transporter AzlC
MAFGVLAQKAGLSVWAIALMSAGVFAGSAQFIAVSMMSAGAPGLSIVLTAFVVNIRHVLMSSSLAVHLHGQNRKFLSLFAYGVTDETFAVNLSRFQSGQWVAGKALTVNHVANGAWIVGSVAGGLGGQFIPEKSFGIDYALSAMFISLLIFQLRSWTHIFTGIAAGSLSLILALAFPGNWYIIVASLFAATLGFTIRRSSGRRLADHARA